ncbi:keratin-associated protein 13-1-like [Castor canadensis]|uniref:Keratin-associated protein n=1 Tax=Castor canadensis TaxID=51338 RepID=A0A8B7TNK9_CASCN
MSYSCCSGSFSSRSLRGCLPLSGSFCGSSYPSNLVYSTNLCSPSPCQLGSSVLSGCHETCGKPTSFLASCVVSSPYQRSYYYPRSSLFCSPRQKTCTGSVGFRSSSCCSLGYGSRSSCSLGSGSSRCYSRGCGSGGFRSLNYGLYGYPYLSYGSRFCHPTYLVSRSCQSSWYRPSCGSGICGFTY